MSVTLIASLVLVCHLVDSKTASLLDIAEFTVLVLTLVALAIYAFDTNSIARVTREDWRRQNVLSSTYSMDIVSREAEPRGRVLFRLTNPSKIIVRAKVKCNFRIYR